MYNYVLLIGTITEIKKEKNVVKMWLSVENESLPIVFKETQFEIDELLKNVKINKNLAVKCKLVANLIGVEIEAVKINEVFN